MEDETGSAIAMASVTAAPGGAAATTGADGKFTLPDLPIGVYTVGIAATGYVPRTVTVSVVAGGDSPIEVRLSRAAGNGTVVGAVVRRTYEGDPAAAVQAATVALVAADVVASSTSGAPLEEAAAASPYATVTGADGRYAISGVEPGAYYVHVAPAGADSDILLPGGDASRIAFEVPAGASVTRDVVLSQKPPASATYIGSVACLACHNGTLVARDFSSWKQTPHALVYRLPDQTTGLQDLSKLPAHDAAMRFFKDSADDPTNTRDNTGTGDGLGLRIGNAGFPRFPTAYNILLGHDGRYFVQFESPAGLRSMKYYLDLTWAGHGLFKQRWLTRVAADGSHAATAADSSLYVLPLQYDEQLQAGAEPFDPFQAGEWGPPTVEGGPASRPVQRRSWDASCAGCHVVGTTLTRDAAGNFRAGAVASVQGQLDSNGDGSLDELGVGCESCHGPGSAHVAAPSRGRKIVMPRLLSAEREDMTCGFCHNRGQGRGTIGGQLTSYPSAGTEALAFPRAGIGRSEFLSFFVESPSRWPDMAGHERANRQQYNDHSKSQHARNARQLVSCGDCHEVHERKNGASLRASVTDNALCLGCHSAGLGLPAGWSIEQEAIAVSAHMQDYAGMTAGYDPTNRAGVAPGNASGGVGSCTSCHMAKIGLNQNRFVRETVDAGGQPSGALVRGDVASHRFDVVLPAQSQAILEATGTNMPNSCGACHNRSVGGVQPNLTY